MNTSIVAFGGMGMQELLIVLLILLLIFGGSRIPGVARALGKSIKEFKKGQRESDDEEKHGDKRTDRDDSVSRKEE